MAIGTGAAIIGGSIIGGGLSYMGSKKAGDAASSANDANIALQREIYGQTRSDMMPYMNAGEAGLEGYMSRLGYEETPGLAVNEREEALQLAREFMAGEREDPWYQELAKQLGYEDSSQLTEQDIANWMMDPNVNMGQGWETKYRDQRDAVFAMGQADSTWDIPEGETIGQFGLDDFVMDPGYNFRMQEGIDNMGYGTSAAGMSLSGSALKDLNRFNQNFASNEFNAAFNRNQLELNNLFNLSTQGQNAAAQTGMMGQQFGQTMSGAYDNQANIGASSAMAPYNAFNTAVNTGQSISSMYQMPTPSTGGTVPYPGEVSYGTPGNPNAGIPGDVWETM